MNNDVGGCDDDGDNEGEGYVRDDGDNDNAPLSKCLDLGKNFR